MTSAPLSSFLRIPATAETRQQATAAGIQVPAEITEIDLQMLMGLSAKDGSEPDCFQEEYDPESMLCLGCVFQAQCWREDQAYLARTAAGTAVAPPNAPKHILAARQAWATSDGPPAAATGDDLRRDDTSRLVKLGYARNQIGRMTEATRERILAESIEAAGISISRTGELRVVGKTKPAAPPKRTPPRRPPPRRKS